MNARSLKKKTTLKSEKGASLVEYALLVALIAVVTVMGVRSVGVGVYWTFMDTGQKIAQCGFEPC